MSLSWHNFFFASFDPAGFVTIDKPPLGFWFQVASVTLFGFSGTSLLLPEALAGVLSVLVLYWLVAATFGQVAGLVAALGLATTPISVVTARNNQNSISPSVTTASCRWPFSACWSASGSRDRGCARSAIGSACLFSGASGC
jgi:hypothetical protein